MSDKRSSGEGQRAPEPRYQELREALETQKKYVEEQREMAVGHIGAVNQWNGYALGLAFALKRLERLAAAAPQELEGRIRLNEALWWIQKFSRALTHWDGCEESHPGCARIKQLERALTRGEVGR